MFRPEPLANAHHWEEEPPGDRMYRYSGWSVQSGRGVKTGRRQLEMRARRPADLGGLPLCKQTALGKFMSLLWLPELDEATVNTFQTLLVQGSQTVRHRHAHEGRRVRTRHRTAPLRTTEDLESIK